MGKKKRKVPKVWCYYCEREFDDEKILVQHQKAKHFKCHVCHKKLSTAGGMAIHVLQVHKENVTKVPNAKPDRESTEIDIFGMEGIPPEILAAHDEQFEDDKSSKIQKVEVPPSGFGGIGLGSPAIRPPVQPTYPVASSMYNSPVTLPMRPPGWPIPTSSQPWSSQPPGVPGQSPLMSARPSHFSQPLQPLFPIQSSQLSTPPVPQPSHGQMLQRPSLNPTQPLFPIQNNPPLSSALSPMPLQSAGQTLYSPSPVIPSYSTPQSQALFPINGQYSTTTVSSVLPLQTSPGLQQMTTPVLTTSRDYSTATMLQSPPMKDNSSAFSGTLPTSAPTPSHMYALGPNTGGPSIGPPPVISNKPPSVQAATAKEVYLVWDDEAMSMEERRMSLTKYQVHDETSQMNSVDAAIDRRILESRLAGRMGFGI